MCATSGVKLRITIPKETNVIRQKLLKLVEDKDSDKLDDQVHRLIGTDVTEYFGSEQGEEIVSIQSISVVAYKNFLHAYVLVNTQPCNNNHDHKLTRRLT